MDLNKAIKGRRSVKYFAEKKPNWKEIIEAIDSSRYAPMAGNMYSLRFILVDNPDKIQALADAAQQPFIADAQYVVVACTDPKLVKNAYPEFADRFLRQQAGAAIQNFLLSIESKNLETCWVGYFIDYLVREALGIPKDIEIEALFPIGHTSKKPGQTQRAKKEIELDRILYFNKWKNKRMKNEKIPEA